MDAQRLARGLGWFSIGLGVTEMLAPGWLGEKIGMGPRTGLLRTLGARETLTGVVALTQPRPVGPIWGRVAGDVMDLAVLGKAAREYGTQKNRLAGAAAAVLGVTLLDVVCALKLQQA
jgi:hypothetical protein